MAKLVYNESGTEREFLLDTGRASYTIGRNPMCDLRINNPSMSRKHAELRLDGASGRFSIRDLDSSNGTFVNGARTQTAPLADGDRIVCGEFELYFVDPTPSAPAAGLKMPAPTAPRQRRSDTFSGLPADRNEPSSGAERREGTVGALARNPTNGGRPGSGSTEGNEPPLPDLEELDADHETVSASMSALSPTGGHRREESPPVAPSDGPWGALDQFDTNTGLMAENERLREWLATAEEKIVHLQNELAAARERSGADAAVAAEIERLRARNRTLTNALKTVTDELQRLAQTHHDLLAGLGTPE